MTGTVTAVSSHIGRSGMVKYIIDWLSDGSGVVTATFAALGLGKVSGWLKSIEAIPGALGIPATNPPSDDYDITLTNVYGFDIAEGTLADRSNTVAEKVTPNSEAAYLDEELTLNISGAGASNQGRLILVFGIGG
jgi:hypothetical protein